MEKYVVITGASRGIGRELALQHLENGDHVLAIARSEDKLRAISNSEKYQYITLDLANYESLDQISTLINVWPRVDVLYNNAGILVNKPFVEISEYDVQYSMSVNYKAPFRMIQICLPKMHGNSHVVNITTMGAVQGSVKFPGLAAYSSSKAGIVTLTELLAQEFETDQPKLNCIALGAVQTEMLEEAFPGYLAPISAKEMASYIMKFGLEGHHFQNGKLVQLSISTP